MAEYIDRERIKLFGFFDAGDYSQAMRCINNMPTADVVEREKIDKAREQMLDSKFHGKTVLTYNDAINDCVKILDKLTESEV